jgi:glycerophosphoryl diester phosphodiesterase
MDCIAHRGFAGVNPENTALAVERAAATGADLVEVDLRRCGSGDLVVVHDETVDRVSDGTGAVADHSLAALRDLDVLDTGAGIPTLAEVFRAAGDTRLNVELKEPGLAADARAVAAECGADPLYSSFEDEVLAELAGTDADLAYVAPEADGAVEAATDLGCVAVHPHWRVCDEAFVERAHEAGLRVNAWTVRSEAAAATAREAGVDGLITDDPAL